MKNYDPQFGKKELERIALDYFIDAYKYTTGEELSLFASGEHPDFICNRSNNEIVGIEFVCDINEKDRLIKITDDRHKPDPQDTLYNIYELIDGKEEKRKNYYIKNVDNTILVIQLLGCSLQSLLPFITEDLKNDFADYGFVEIWLADYTGIEAYRDIELFGLSPTKWWGYHQRENPYRKPYG